VGKGAEVHATDQVRAQATLLGQNDSHLIPASTGNIPLTFQFITAHSQPRHNLQAQAAHYYGLHSPLRVSGWHGRDDSFSITCYHSFAMKACLSSALATAPRFQHLRPSAPPRQDGRPPLHIAAYHGRLGLIDKLLEKGADIEARDDEVSSLLRAPPHSRRYLVTPSPPSHTHARAGRRAAARPRTHLCRPPCLFPTASRVWSAQGFNALHRAVCSNHAPVALRLAAVQRLADNNADIEARTAVRSLWPLRPPNNSPPASWACTSSPTPSPHANHSHRAHNLRLQPGRPIATAGLASHRHRSTCA
jgi:hypothetical protein